MVNLNIKVYRDILIYCIKKLIDGKGWVRILHTLDTSINTHNT
jgi:hypothetical protein